MISRLFDFYTLIARRADKKTFSDRFDRYQTMKSENTGFGIVNVITARALTFRSHDIRTAEDKE